MKINSVHIPENAKIYLCGPTVYQRIHIGNLRSMILCDILFRTLPNATFVRNITDIDDKIIDRADNILQFTKDRIDELHYDLESVGLLKPTFEPRVTDYIDEIINMIQLLIDKGYAYISNDHVLFNISKYKHYGQTFNIDMQKIKNNVRKEFNHSMKQNDHDFILWKPDNQFWNSPWGYGRPGWHIECSAMISAIFNSTIDLHCGGSDLIFPHHTNEEAQSCCALNMNSLSRAWMHNAMLNIDNNKMSKSENNVITVYDLRKILHATTIRIALLNTIYYKILNWNQDLIDQSIKIANKIYRFLSQNNIQEVNNQSEGIDAIHNNLNTPLAINLLQSEMKTNPQSAINTMNILGILDTYRIDLQSIDIDATNRLYKQYIQYRNECNYQAADKIRNTVKNIEFHDKGWNFYINSSVL